MLKRSQIDICGQTFQPLFFSRPLSWPFQTLASFQNEPRQNSTSQEALVNTLTEAISFSFHRKYKSIRIVESLQVGQAKAR